MKKSFFKTAIFAMATAALIFAGCNSDSGGGEDYPEITKVTISGLPESAVSGPVELTAAVEGNNLEGAGIEYSWEVAEGSGYASFENSDAKTSKLVPNCAAEEKEVKIKVTANLKGTENGKSSEVYTVKIAKKTESGTEGSGSGSGSGTGNTEGGTTGGSTGSGSDTGSSEGGTTGGNTGSGSGAEGGSTGGNTESGSTTETGSVSAVVNADGSISCGKCGKIYNFTEQAKNCEHYKCATCGSVYCSQSEIDSCTSHVTVIFKDSGENGNEIVTKVIKSGSTVIPPSWEKENFALTWIDENGKEADFDNSISLSEGETEKTVTFTLDKRSLAWYSTELHDWYAASGEYQILIAASARDVRLKKTIQWESAQRLPLHIHLNSTLGELLKDERTRELGKELKGKLDAFFGAVDGTADQIDDAVSDDMGDAMAMSMPIRNVLSFGLADKEELQAKLDELNNK